MSQGTEIQWATDTWNALSGCIKVSRGCQFCYAARLAGTRLKHTDKYAGLAMYDANAGVPRWITREVRFTPEHLMLPLGWKRADPPRRIFVNSMSDLFVGGARVDLGEEVPEEVIFDHFTVMANTPWHRYLVLTKRPERMARILKNIGYYPIQAEDGGVARMGRYEIKAAAAWSSSPMILPNVAIGVSVESPDYLERVRVLQEIPAACRFVSAEPLVESLGDVSWWFGGLRPVDWVIVGGESGPRGKVATMRAEWARDLYGQTKAAGKPFFFKQVGDNPHPGDAEAWRNLSDAPHEYPDLLINP